MSITPFSVTKITNVTDGGSPDIGDQPTAGKIKDLIDSLVDLSDEFATQKTSIEGINESQTFHLGEDIASDLEVILRITKDNILKLKQIYYGDYHATELPNDISAPYYGGTQGQYFI